MSKDNISLKVTYEGKLEEAEAGLAFAVDKELRSRIGLQNEDVSVTNQKYTVTLQLANDSRASNQYTGTSTASVDDAVRDATKATYDSEKVQVELEKTVEAPYFTVPVVVRSVSKEKLAGYHADAVNELLNTYGNRVNQSPDSVEFKVVKTKKQYQHDAMLPKGEECWLSRKLYVVAEGKSNLSMDEALQQAETKSKKVSSTVYEQRAEIMVYGNPEASLKLSREGLAFPMVVTSSKTQPRGAQPAARDPVALTNSYAYM